MSSCMRPCTACARHVKYADTTCPFCGEGLEAKACAPKAASPARLTRAAIVFASATAVTACGGESTPTASDAGTSGNSASSSSSSSSGETTSGAMPAYGAIAFPVDAGNTSSSSSTTGGSGPAYGAPPFGGSTSGTSGGSSGDAG